jgi:hypothetical protein
MTAALLPVPGQTWVEGAGHAWCDDGECVVVRLPAGEADAAALAQRLRVSVGAASLRVELTGDGAPLLEVAELHAEVVPVSTTWSFDAPARALLVRLFKVDPLAPWTALAAGDAGAVDGGAALAERAKVEALLRAAAAGDEAALRAAAAQLDDGDGLPTVLAAVKDGNGRGALHFAALRGHAALCSALVRELRMEADARDEEGA